VKNLKLWLLGLLHAALGGITVAVTAGAIDPKSFNLNSGAGWGHLGMAVAAGAAPSVLSYLTKPATEDTPPVHRPPGGGSGS
jgi:hypothetical protein